MHVAEVPCSSAIPASAGLASRWSIVILAVAAFVVVTTEFLIVGLIPALSRDLHVSTAVAGQLVTLFAFTVMLFGPVLTVFVSHVDRKRLFTIILLIFAASNALAAVAPNLWVLAVARFVPALALPVFWGTASDTASRIAGPARAGRAVSRVYLGISGALLFGIPLGTVVGDAFGWRDSFWGLAALSLVMAALIATFMPRTARPERQPIADQLGILTDSRFVANVLLSVIVFTAMFTAYTYLADLLERVAGVAPSQVGWWLMGFGTIGLVGNGLGGRAVERGPLAATAAFTAVLGVAMVASVLAAHTVWPFIAALAIWGIAYTALFPVCQIRVMKAGGRAQALAGTLNVSAANAGIGLGAVLGGITITQAGLASIGFVAALVAGIALGAVVVVRRMSSNTPTAR
jgi:DHA1 family inner membrane transport protein